MSAWRDAFFFFSSRRRNTRCIGDWSSDVCSSDLRLVLPDRAVVEVLERGGGPTRTALSFQNFDDSSVWQDQPGVSTATYTLSSTPATLHHNDTVKANGHVYKYLGSDFTPVVDLSAMDYGTRTMWAQVGLTSSPLEVQAYIFQSSVSATGALTLLALSNQTINATDVAASAAIAIGAGGIALTGAGAATENKVYDQVRAYIDGSGTGGISAPTVLLSRA